MSPPAGRGPVAAPRLKVLIRRPCLVLVGRRAALASRRTSVIDFALEDFMTLLEIIKRTNIKFSQTKSIAFVSPPAQRGSLRSSEWADY